jgi:hypothetical protein
LREAVVIAWAKGEEMVVRHFDAAAMACFLPRLVPLAGTVGDVNDDDSTAKPSEVVTVASVSWRLGATAGDVTVGAESMEVVATVEAALTSSMGPLIILPLRRTLVGATGEVSKDRRASSLLCFGVAFTGCSSIPFSAGGPTSKAV